MLRVGLHENISILFLLAIKTAGSAQKLRVGQVSGNTAIFCLRLIYVPSSPFDPRNALNGLHNNKLICNMQHVWLPWQLLMRVEMYRSTKRPYPC